LIWCSRTGSDWSIALMVVHRAVRNLEDYRRPSVGIRFSGWQQALQAFTIYCQGPIPPDDRHDHLHKRLDAPLTAACHWLYSRRTRPGKWVDWTVGYRRVSQRPSGVAENLGFRACRGAMTQIRCGLVGGGSSTGPGSITWVPR